MIQGTSGVESDLEDRAVLEMTSLYYRVGSWICLAAAGCHSRTAVYSSHYIVMQYTIIEAQPIRTNYMWVST